MFWIFGLQVCGVLALQGVKVKVTQSHLTLCDPMDCSPCQAPLSVEFSRTEYWSGLPFPSPEGLPDPGIEPGSCMLQADSLSSELPGKPFGSPTRIKPTPPALEGSLNHWTTREVPVEKKVGRTSVKQEVVY